MFGNSIIQPDQGIKSPMNSYNVKFIQTKLEGNRFILGFQNTHEVYHQKYNYVCILDIIMHLYMYVMH